MPVSGKGFFGRVISVGNGIANTCIPYILDGCRNITDISGFQQGTGPVSGIESTYFNDVKFTACSHKAHFHTWTDGAVHDPYKTDNAFVIVIISIKNQSLQRSIRIAFRGRNMIDYCLQHIFHIQPGFC